MNYFGAQRFGSARHGQGWVARRLVEGDFEGALRLAIATPARRDAGRTRAFTRLASRAWGDWKRLARELPACPERRAIQTLARGGDFVAAFAALPPYLQAMYVEAHQSILWNEAARRVAWDICADAHTPLRSDDVFGELIFPPAAAVSPAWRAATMPLPAPGAKPEGPAAAALNAALEADGLSFAKLRIPGVRRPFYARGERGLFATAGAFNLGAPEPDEGTPRAGRLKRRLSFELARGAYATVVLRALGQ
jgi:tRNA pseudouridine13 synthase